MWFRKRHAMKFSLKNLLDQINAGIILADKKLNFVYLNQAAEVLFAISSRNASEFFLKRSTFLDELPIADLITESNNQNQSITKRGAKLNIPGKEALTVDCSIGQMDDEKREPLTLIELQQIDRHLRIRDENQIISQQSATRDLIRGLSHEIKNPLSGLRGSAQLLDIELKKSELREYTQIIIKEADRLRELVDKMLGPNEPANYQRYNIHHILNRAIGLISKEIESNSIIFKEDYDISIPEMTGNTSQLIQAFLNILKNAIGVLKQGGRIISRTRICRNFTIGSIRHRFVAQIDIEDNGPGVDSDIKDTLFLPKVSSDQGFGLGLGLSISQTLIAQHGGLVECQSSPGKTIFTIFLPLFEEK